MAPSRITKKRRAYRGAARSRGGRITRRRTDEEALQVDDLPPYKYEQLTNPGQIRVLQLHMTKGDVIDLELKPVQHSDGGYQALSYVWGSEDKPFRATVHNGTGAALGYIPLTLSLFNALRDLRDSEGVKSKQFWIDQICIDQQGDEKNHQVAIMGEIYRNAAGVITYLGPTEDQGVEESTVELLDRIYDHFSPNFDMLLEIGDLSDAYDRRASFPVPALPSDLEEEVTACAKGGWVLDDAASKKWRHLTAWAYGDWTQRLWMVQEQLLNRNTQILGGRRLLRWDTIATTTFWFYLQFLPDSWLTHFWTQHEFDDE
ncbi:heterokaryon incompatibility protein-domain-containing protein [Immersiella caudata]|uniref:Heterokaryon incompatibility protein-domain-containing protein n=1 Tax=Immersiella caudata TaxID=314043 RepID=A0AA40C105_9PEZI|nr:heterokaryon incompatibility protein-domain-containing protein [Immersiella caudata]